MTSSSASVRRWSLIEPFLRGRTRFGSAQSATGLVDQLAGLVGEVAQRALGEVERIGGGGAALVALALGAHEGEPDAGRRAGADGDDRPHDVARVLDRAELPRLQL